MSRSGRRRTGSATSRRFEPTDDLFRPRNHCVFKLIGALGDVVRAVVKYRWPGAMTSGVARTRLIDDMIRSSVREGISQIVLLGAGFDCRAHRIQSLADCRVVEIDHPNTSALKRECLKELIGEGPSDVVYLEADLTRRDLTEVLLSSELDFDRPVFVLWEGVTHYLGEAAVDGSLRAISNTLAGGGQLLFTYIHRGLLDGTIRFDGASRSAEQVSADGEPWIWGMDPAMMPDYLAERGFRLLEDLGAEQYRSRYWGERGRRMKGFAFYRVALAKVIGSDV